MLLVHAPDAFARALDPLPDGVTLETNPNEPQYDTVIVCVSTIAEAGTHPVTAAKYVKPGGLFWACYPKKTGAIRTDITRDQGWETLKATGWGPVAQVSVDETWSALRWRPEADIIRKGSMR